MENPFIYGEVVTGKNLCGREDETKELLRDIRNSQKVLLFSPRRYGKTSLLKDIFINLNKKEFFTIYVDLYPALNESDFIKLLAKAFSSGITAPLYKTLNVLKDTFKHLASRLSFTINKEGNIEFDISLEKHDISPVLVDLLEGINSYITKNGKKGVIVFDEFQQVNYFEKDKVEKELRSQMQSQRNICYIFSGSKKHLLMDMFANPNRPFYKSTKHFQLDKLKSKDIFRFIKTKFQDTDIEIKDDLINKVIDISECHPFYFQYICHEMWEMSFLNGKVADEYLERSVDRIMERETSSYDNIWSLLSLKQKKTLIALSKILPQEKIFSNNFITKYNIGPVSTLQRVLNGLVKKELIDKVNNNYEILDIIFKKWIQRIY
ncbi:MAG: ATP-binding protein [Elusimicrobiales bacterium]|jgi:AAA+ ATPase superfamily predicted ATPase|nr:ATP-binding protein [Elusimicrobiales bacterium]NLH39675.1 ATP-binding protein [Elusimicrobiota bacterium]